MGILTGQKLVDNEEQGPVEKEVKEWLKLERTATTKLCDTGKDFDHTNIASLINLLHCTDLITDFEKKRMTAIYE